MNILFNASQCGLGNNGGTKTIMRCAETLQGMGHGVFLWANTNNYTWHKPNVAIRDSYSLLGSGINNVKLKEIIVSVWELAGANKKKNLKNTFFYMRGWEKWYKGEQYLIEQIKKFTAAGGRIVVNSSWLIDQLKEKAGVDSVLCYSGLDLDFWGHNLDIDGDNIGTLGPGKHKTKRFDLIEQLWSQYKKRTFSCSDGSFNNKRMYNLYNSCNIWFAPTEFEGFHQCPAEANLCGCLVVCNRLKSNGMSDYATDETAMRYDTWDELIECIENPDFSKVAKMQKVLREKIGNRKDNMKRFVDILEG